MPNGKVMIINSKLRLIKKRDGSVKPNYFPSYSKNKNQRG